MTKEKPRYGPGLKVRDCRQRDWAMPMAKSNGKRGNGQFAALPHAVIKSSKYASLDGWAVKLLVDLLVQYNGRNNGDLSAPWSLFRYRGWRSKGTLAASLRALRQVGFIITTRPGGRHQCSLYAVAWYKIDECIDRQTGQAKHDLSPTLAPPGGWNDDAEPVDPPPQKSQSQVAMWDRAVAMRSC